MDNKYIGLTDKEAAELLSKNGPNVLKEEKPKTILQMFIGELWNFTNLILAAAIIISFILGDYTEAGIICFIVIVNAIIGVVQENKAQKALEALKKMSVLKATVIRNGEKKEISSEELVVGDIVCLDAGQLVPADLVLLETANLKVDEKALTGESVPVEKDCDFVPPENAGIGDMRNKAYMSTVVTYGRGVGKVEKTGMSTEIGKIADMVQAAEEKPSPLQVSMDKLSKTLGVICIVVCALMFGLGVLQKKDILEMLMSSVSLAVAAIPEGIPTIVTIVLALGVQRIAKVNALVKKLPAIEALGCVSYVCSDKTGTLTQNKMTVVKAFANGKYLDIKDMGALEKNEELLRGFVLCNDAVITKDGKEIGDPTETALVRFGLNSGLEKELAEQKAKRINEIPFDSDRKLMTTMHRIETKKEPYIASYTKGSTDALIQRCTKILDNGKVRDITEDDRKLIDNAMSEMSFEALRVLSLAYRVYLDSNDIPTPVEQDLVYVGMVGMIDPEREEVKASIETFKTAGIKTVMITGDHKDTAFAIAKKLGIAESIDECIMGYELNAMSDEELRNQIKDKGISVFARVSPEHKVKIVKALQDNGYIVSMTGKLLPCYMATYSRNLFELLGTAKAFVATV